MARVVHVWTPVGEFATSKDPTLMWQVDRNADGGYRCHLKGNDKSRCPGLVFNPVCPECETRLVSNTPQHSVTTKVCPTHGVVPWACKHILYAINHPEECAATLTPAADPFYQTVYDLFRARFGARYANEHGAVGLDMVVRGLRFKEAGCTHDDGRFKAFVDDLRLALGPLMKTVNITAVPVAPKLGVRRIVLD